MNKGKGMNPKDLVGAKKAALRLVPPALEIVAAPAMVEGAKKYGPFNWRTGPKIQYSAYLEATRRHILALMDGEDADPKTGIHHLSSIAANAGIMADALWGGFLVDDRPPPGPASLMLAEQDKSKKVKR